MEDQKAYATEYREKERERLFRRSEQVRNFCKIFKHFSLFYRFFLVILEFETNFPMFLTVVKV